MLTDALTELWGDDVDWKSRLLFSEHHASHAASAFFPSSFESAAVLTMDGVDEWATTSLAIGEGNRLSMHKEIRFPHSLGLLYSAFTYYTGFKELTGCPVLVNTSFNVRGEPIVCSPEDAFRCFMGTELDLLVIGNAILHKTRQSVALAADHKAGHELD